MASIHRPCLLVYGSCKGVILCYRGAPAVFQLRRGDAARYEVVLTPRFQLPRIWPEFAFLVLRQWLMLCHIRALCISLSHWPLERHHQLDQMRSTTKRRTARPNFPPAPTGRDGEPFHGSRESRARYQKYHTFTRPLWGR